MKRNPIRSLGVVFAAVAGVELAALLVLAAVVRQREALLVLALVLGLQALIFGASAAGACCICANGACCASGCWRTGTGRWRT